MSAILGFYIVLLTGNIFNMISAPGAQELELRIGTEKSDYAVGETILLEIGLCNLQNQTIKVPKYFMLPADDPKNNLDIHVYDANGDRLSRVSHVATGRALYFPEIQLIDRGETYRESFPLAGTFTQRHGPKKVKQALWSLGENPESSINDYPPMLPGTFKVKVIYHVDKNHLTGLSEAQSATIWKGQLISNTIEISIV